jgi:hypothetical protein
MVLCVGANSMVRMSRGIPSANPSPEDILEHLQVLLKSDAFRGARADHGKEKQRDGDRRPG